MIEIKDASFGYKEKNKIHVVTEHLNLSVRPGQLLCMLGPNGAGKTTVFRTILGTLPLLGGEILVDEKPLTSYTRAALAKKISYVPQQHTPPFPYSVIQVVEMGRCVHIKDFSSPSDEDERIAEDMLKKLGIHHLRDRIYTELSGGERQLVLIARALAQEAEYMLLDEPTASLDFGNQSRLLSVVQSLAEDGKGILMILHDPEQALKLDGEVVLLKTKSSSVCGTAEELINEDLIRELYGISAEIHTWTSAQGNKVRSIYTDKTVIQRKGENMMESRFNVEGIMCPNCVAKITKTLMALDGVGSVNVSEDYKTVTVKKDDKIPDNIVKEAIEGIEEKDFKVLA